MDTTYELKYVLRSSIDAFEREHQLSLDWTKPLLTKLLERVKLNINCQINQMVENEIDDLLNGLPLDNPVYDHPAPINLRCILKGCKERISKPYPVEMRGLAVIDTDRYFELRKELKTPTYRYCDNHISELEELGLIEAPPEITPRS